jgi:hypothetical protein
MAETISRALKSATAELQYHANKRIPISRINTHSLRSGGANALALAGYSDTPIQKMGRWCGTTFKEYIRGELACYARGMSHDMKPKFNFVSIAEKAFTEITYISASTAAPERLSSPHTRRREQSWT